MRSVFQEHALGGTTRPPSRGCGSHRGGMQPREGGRGVRNRCTASVLRCMGIQAGQVAASALVAGRIGCEGRCAWLDPRVWVRTIKRATGRTSV